MNMPRHPSPDPPPRTDAAWLDAHWMPYTGNRDFKANPRMMASCQRLLLHRPRRPQDF